MANTQVEFYVSQIRGRFPTTAEPTLEDVDGVDSINRNVAETSQIPDIVDGNRDGRLTISSDLLTGDDSTFASDTGNYTLGTGVSIGGGALNFSGGGGDASITLNSSTADYEVIFTMAAYNAGAVAISIGGGGAGTSRNADGTYTETITGGATQIFLFDGDATFDASITIVTVRLKDKFRFDLALDERIDADCLIVDNHNTLENTPADLRAVFALYYDTDGTFAGATGVTLGKEIGGLIGRDRAYLDIDQNSGAAPVSIADHADLDFGTGAFSVVFLGTVQEFINHGSIYNTLIGKGSIAAGPAGLWAMGLQSTGILQFFIRGTTNFADSDSDIADNIERRYVGTRESDGTITLYVDGVAQATTGTDAGDVDNATVLTIGSDNNSGRTMTGGAKKVLLYNRALSAAEILAFETDDSIAAADQWGSQTDITPTGQAWSDSNTEGNSVAGLTSTACALSSVTEAGETPAATHAGTWMVKMALAAGSSYCGESFSTTIGEKYRASGWCYVPAGTGGFTQLRVGTSSNNNDLGSDSYTIRDAWVYVQVEYIATATTTYISFLNGATSGNMYVDDVVNVEIGCVAEYSPEGISETQTTWFDRTANSHDGTISGCDYKLNPGYAIYHAKFTSVNARYWFLEINPDSETLLATDLKIGQFDLCKAFLPSLNPDVSSITELQNYEGVEAIQKYGGGYDLNERHGRRRVWTFGWSFLTDSDKANFQDLLEQSKKRVIYFSDDADQNEPHVYAARILESPQFTVPAQAANNIVLTLIEEV